MRTLVATVAQIAGIGLVLVGSFAVSPIFGAGLCLFAAGVAVDPPSRDR